MHSVVFEIEQTVEEYLPGLRALDEEESGRKPLPDKWSKKELIGHLIDSAQNNLRRFIVAQYDVQPHIVYKQDEWVSINNYQSYSNQDLIELWRLLNKQICTVLSNASAQALERLCETESVNTIGWLAKDYVQHMKHHLHQVLELSPIPYP
ncbi:MAG: DinB family protein [Flavisolibacter sp.]